MALNHPATGRTINTGCENLGFGPWVVIRSQGPPAARFGLTNYTRADCIHRLPVHPAEAGLELFTWRRGEEKGNILLGLLG